MRASALSSGELVWSSCDVLLCEMGGREKEKQNHGAEFYSRKKDLWKASLSLYEN